MLLDLSKKRPVLLMLVTRKGSVLFCFKTAFSLQWGLTALQISSLRFGVKMLQVGEALNSLMPPVDRVCIFQGHVPATYLLLWCSVGPSPSPFKPGK